LRDKKTLRLGDRQGRAGADSHPRGRQRCPT
jgi:hypothetical protein